MLPEGVTC